MATIDKLEYINGTKTLIKNALNTNFNSQIGDGDTFRSYVQKIDDIYENWPKVSEENTNFTLNSTKEGKMKIKLKGNTSQETITGKNLFNRESITWATNETIIYTTISIPNGTYTMSSPNMPVGTDNICNLFVIPGQASTGASSSINGVDKNTPRTLTITGGKITIGERKTTEKNTNNPYDYDWQLESGSTATSYEPYTNGASPNPEYPQDIHVVSGDNTINVYGKNILYYVDKTTSWGGAKINTLGNTITYTPNTSGQGGMGHTTYTQNLFIPSGSTLTFSQRYVSGSAWTSGSLTNSIRLVRKDGTYLAKGFGDITTSIYQNTKKVTFTIEEDYIGIQCYSMMYAIAGMTTPLVYNVQLEYNSNITDFEPYQSQSYPINLPVENLFDGELEQGGYQTSNGEKTPANNNYRNKNIIPVKPNTTYTFSIDGTKQKYVLLTYGSTQNFKEQILNDTGTFTTNSDVYYINFRCYQNDYTSDFANLKVQLEKGTTPYETTPIELCKIGDYQDSIKKSTGKNLFENVVYKDSYIVASDGSETGNALGCIWEKIKVKPNTTYTLSYTSTDYSFAQRVSEYNSSDTFIQRSTTQTSPYTFTTTSTTEYINLSGFKTDTNIMIEEGTTATSYEPYGIGWYVKKGIGKAVLDGTENWEWASEQNGAFTHWFLNYGKAISYSPTLCNYFLNSQNTTWVDNRYGFNQVGGTMWIKNTSIFNSLSNFTTWLETNKPIVYYQLANPTYIEITDNTLISQLEALKKAISYDKKTSINQNNNDLPFILNVSALKKNNSN